MFDQLDQHEKAYDRVLVDLDTFSVVRNNLAYPNQGKFEWQSIPSLLSIGSICLSTNYSVLNEMK